MNTIEKILSVVRQRGLTIGLKDGRAVITGDPALVTPQLHAALVEFRAAILDHLKLEATEPTPAAEPDFTRTVFTIDAFGDTSLIVNPYGDLWKHGKVAWQYHWDAGWRPIVGKEVLFPAGLPHA